MLHYLPYLHLINTGVDNSTGGNNSVANIEYNACLSTGSVTGGDNVTISSTNSGTNTTSTGNTVATILNPQLEFGGMSEVFGDNFTLYGSNTGLNTTLVAGTNRIAVIGDPQVQFGNLTVGNNATITAINSGTNTGPDNSSTIGFIDYKQFSLLNFSAGNSLIFTIRNTGTESGSNGGDNIVGAVEFRQVDAINFATGDDAVITISNEGIDSSPQTTNSVGVLFYSNQFNTSGSTTFGKNCTINVSNSATNTGGSTQVGYIDGSQINFGGLLTMDDGTSVTTTNNSGTVTQSQMVLVDFKMVSGRGSLTAINSGSIGGVGINIVGAGATGGNALINLTNSSLVVDSTAEFTIGGLNGDMASSATSISAPIIIATDPDVQADFGGGFEILAIQKTGLGKQTISGEGITLDVDVQEGTLNLTGAILSSGGLQIDPAGILTGTGALIGPVTNSGTISPGESIGTLTFASYTNNPIGVYDVEVNGQGASDLILVTGPADILGGPVVVSTVDGTYKFYYRYTIVDANGGVTGQYASVVPLSPVIKAQLSKDADHVYLSLSPNFSIAGRTHNEREVAQQLDSITNPNTIQNMLLSEIANLSSVEQVTAALDSLSGSQHTNDYLASYFVNRQFIRRLYDPIRNIVTTNPCCNRCPNGWTAYVEEGGAFVELHPNTECHGFNYNGNQITAGVQGTFGRKWTIGIAGSYEYDRLHYKFHGGSARNQTGLVGLYGLFRPQCFYTFADIAYSYGFNKVHRAIHVGSDDFHANSKPNLSQATAYAEIGVDLPLWCLMIQPFVGIEGAQLWRDHFVESPAGGWELDVHKRCRSSATSRAGLHLTGCLDCINVSIDVAWDASLTNQNNAIREQFVQFGTPIDIWGVNLDWNSVDYALTLSAQAAPTTRVYLQGSGESWNNAHFYNVEAGLLFSW